MSAGKPTKFQLFFWGGGEDGEGYYSTNVVVLYWPPLDSAVKYKLAAAIGTLVPLEQQNLF